MNLPQIKPMGWSKQSTVRQPEKENPMKVIIHLEERNAIEQKLGHPLPSPNSKEFDQLLVKLAQSNPELKTEIEAALKPIGTFSALNVQANKAKDNEKTAQIWQRLFTKKTGDGQVVDKTKIWIWTGCAAALIVAVGLAATFVIPAKKSGLALGLGGADGSPEAEAQMALPKGSLKAGLTGSPNASNGTGATGGSDGAISTSDADPMGGTARAGRNGSPAPVTTSYVAQPTQIPSSYSSTAAYGSSGGGNGSYGANPSGSSSYYAGSLNNATSGSYQNATNANLRPSNLGGSSLGGQTVRPGLVVSTARVSIRGSRPLPSGLGAAPQAAMDASNPAISTPPVNGAPSLAGDGVSGGTIAMRSSAPLETSANGRGVQGSGVAVRSAGLEDRTINAGFVIRGQARAVAVAPALGVQGVSSSKTMPGMIVRGNEARAAGQGSSGGIGVRGTEARSGFGGIGSQDRSGNSGAGNSGASNPATGNMDIQARGPQSTPPAAPVMPATEGFPTDSGVRADAPTFTARATAQTSPQEVQPLESVLPGFFIGQKLEASLTIALVAVEQGVAPLVAVTQNPPCGKDRCSPVVWIGQAQLGPDRRIWVSIDQASYEGRTYSVRGQALGAQDLRPGLQAAVWDEAPTLVSDLVRGALGGFSDYLGAQLGAKTTTVIPGGGVTQTGSVPDLANFFDSRLAGLFSIPAESKALVRVARVEPESKFIVLFGIAPQLAARQR
jgi:hypothetical protein